MPERAAATGAHLSCCCDSLSARPHRPRPQEPTIGAAFLTQTVALDDATVKFEIWDTAGQERYRSLAPMYYRGASAAIVVYDITNKDRWCPRAGVARH